MRTTAALFWWLLTAAGAASSTSAVEQHNGACMTDHGSSSSSSSSSNSGDSGGDGNDDENHNEQHECASLLAYWINYRTSPAASAVTSIGLPPDGGAFLESFGRACKKPYPNHIDLEHVFAIAAEQLGSTRRQDRSNHELGLSLLRFGLSVEAAGLRQRVADIIGSKPIVAPALLQTMLAPADDLPSLPASLLGTWAQR